MTLSQMTIPNTNYNVNTNNNSYSVSFTTGLNTSYTLSVPVGNYTATSLAYSLNSSLNAQNPPLSVSYSDLTGGFTFNSVSLNFALLQTSTALNVFGFNASSTTPYLSNSSYLTSQRVVDLSGNRCFYFTTNLPTENINFMQPNTGRAGNQVASIQMESDSVGIEYYHNITGFKSKINTNRIELIHVQLYDDDSRIYIPQHPYTFVLEFNFYDRNDSADTILQSLSLNRK
jgi:hypothetical protein